MSEVRPGVPAERAWVEGGADVPRWVLLGVVLGVLVVVCAMVLLLGSDWAGGAAPAGPVVTPTTYGPPR